ncbi:MAG: hypothetical protein EOO57_03400 [Hymenobacter sp.]|nr:MAG: hypothetical protein EOO57_03400 [Hymenobacter sp.]
MADNGYKFDGSRGQGLLFDAPHNAHETRGRRVHGWQEVADILLQAVRQSNAYRTACSAACIARS